jgi:cytochrome c oxidase subunit 3
MNIFKELGDKSWATPGAIGEITERSSGAKPAEKTGLNFFLAVLTSMFGLFLVGYRMRMDLPDWVPLNDPQLLWFNTGLLILSAIAMQLAKNAANRGQIGGVRLHLTLAGVLTVAFLIGQYVVWQELLSAGLYQLASAPLAFFLLLTGLHALHLAGGLYVWMKSAVKAWSGMEITRFKLSIELCTTYWHYLLLVWFAFFAMLLST